MNFRLAFLNCYNLFPPQMQVSRPGAPQNQAEVNAKVASLAGTIRTVFGGDVPEIIALSEIGSAPLGQHLARVLDVTGYRSIWSGTPPVGRPQTGVMLLYNPDVFAEVTGSMRFGPRSITERPKWLAARFRLHAGSRGAFWLVVNHWKSHVNDWNAGVRAGSDPLPPLSEIRQIESAQEIGRLYLEQEHEATEAIILIGDFNCEPGDKPWKGHQPNRLTGARQRAVVLRRRNRKAYFYNPMWRFMGEAHDYDTANTAEYEAPYMMGTFVGVNNRIIAIPLWDQLLVSKGLLIGRQIHFAESSLTIVRPETGYTDHCAVGAGFTY